MKHASLYSGFGGFDLAAEWMGWENVFWCEVNEFCRNVLSYWFYKSKGYGNIKETDFTPWRGKIDILTGGFPCQPFSVAGQRKGATDDRYLWPEMLRAIREIQPTWVIGENVAGILSMVQPGSEITVESQASLFETADKETLLDEEYVVETICRDFEQEGYCVQPVVIPACAVGAPHRRDRVWFIAHRADTGVESMRPKRENTICGFETSTDANSNDAGRSGHGKTGCKAGICQGSERQWEWIRGDVKRNGEERIIANAQRQRSEQVQQEIQSKKSSGNSINGIGCKRNVTDTNDINGNISGFCSGRLPQFETSEIFKNRRDWRDFPSQSPICRGNDGLPFDVDSLTIPYSEWTEESIKGYGNAIAPDVAYAIFELIEDIENSDYEE